MSLNAPGGPINAEEADNFEEIEKQFAVKGTAAGSVLVDIPALTASQSLST